MVTDEKSYDVTGELTPDVTGTYNDAGEFNGKRYYQLAGNGWYIHWDGDINWLINDNLGGPGANFWRRSQPTIPGQFFPQDGAVGIATVTEI